MQCRKAASILDYSLALFDHFRNGLANISLRIGLSNQLGTWSISQGRGGSSNGVPKMNLFKAGGHSF